MNRHLPLEGVDNFRDFGGYRGSGGRALKRGRLFRSASHGRATEADLATISALRLSAIIDLRRPDERRRDPSRRPPGFAGEVLSNDEGGEAEDSWHVHVRGSDLSPASFREYLSRYYHAAPVAPRHIDLFSRYFRALAVAEGPILIHCAAGKDRTGLLAALTHHLAGVHRDDILADYLLTNDEARIARRAPLVAEAIRALAGRAPTDAAVRVAMGVEPEFLETAFRAMANTHGSIDAYLEKAVGVDSELRARLEAKLLD